MNEEKKDVSFVDFGKSYQRKVVQAILNDHDFAQQIIEILNVEFFEQKFLQYLVKTFFEYFKRYEAFPSLQTLATVSSQELSEGDDLVIKKQIKDYLVDISKNPLNGDEKYIKESSLDFCKKQALKAALLESVKMIQHDKYEQIVDLIKGSIEIGAPKNHGHDYINDIEARHSAALARKTIPTGWYLLDAKNILNGGLARGELGAVMGVSGTGKSMFLVHIGAQALKLGYNVLHYTFELSENCVGLRYDACLTGVSQNDAYKLKEAIKSYITQITEGRLFIKSFPMKTASVQTLKNHMRVLETVKSFKPDLVIVDYADIMRSIKGYDAKRFELESIYEDLRSTAQELDVAIWTASQVNRSAVNSEIVDLDTISESFAKVQVADIVLTFSRTKEDKQVNGGRVFLGKNRIGQDGLIFDMNIDTSTVSIKLLEKGDSDLDIETPEHEQRKHIRNIKEKWEETRREVAQHKET